jgi:phage terminase small subunit
MPSVMPLTPKQQRFVAEYATDLNATQAAIRAGYSAKTASEQAARLLANVRVQAAVQAAQAQRLARLDFDGDRVLRELGRIGFSDLRHLFTPAGDLIPIHQLPPAVTASLASVEVIMKNATAGDGKIDRVLKIRLWDKNKALTDLARHFALLVDRVEVSGAVSLTAKIAAARQRGAKLLAARNGEAD